MSDKVENIKIIKVVMNRGDKREQFILALTNAGYKVWIRKQNCPIYETSDIYVYFEVLEKNIIDKEDQR